MSAVRVEAEKAQGDQVAIDQAARHGMTPKEWAAILNAWCDADEEEAER